MDLRLVAVGLDIKSCKTPTLSERTPAMDRRKVAIALADRAAQLFRPTESARLGSETYPTYRRSDFRAMTRLHTFTFLIEAPASEVADIVALAELSREWARKHKGGLPAGMQTGTVAMPVFVISEISSALWDWASSSQPARFASGLFPIVVSADARFAAYRRTPAKIGIFYESFLRQIADNLLSVTGAN